MDVLLRIVSCLLVLILGLSIINGSCPPVGSYECIEISRYSARQYATCLTDSYIQTTSGHRHLCIDRTATYCWYQCMLEVHDKTKGEVTDDCACSQLNTTAKQDLPVECYSPSGDDCGWYTKCLEKRYPCKDDPATYAVDFAQRFCLLYAQHYQSFSSLGRSWIDAVRKCLQVKLVPSLRPGQNKSCAQLRDFAFGTHYPCYVSPDGGRNSVCKLTFSDFQRVFWTIFQGYNGIDKSKTEGALVSIFGQMISVGSYCSAQWTSNAARDVIEFAIKSNPFATDGTKSTLAFKLTHQTSTTMQWEENHVMWFGYPVSVHNNINTENSTLNVRIVLASKGLYDLNSVNVPIVNVSSVIDDLSDAIVNGDLKFNLGKDINVALFKVCSDINCTTSTFETVPQNYNPAIRNGNGESFLLRNILIGCSVGLILFFYYWPFID